MKRNPNFIPRTIVDETVIIPTGAAAQYFNGMISTNPVAGFIWEHLEACDTPQDMIEKVLENFDVDRETATVDVSEFLETLKSAGMISY